MQESTGLVRHHRLRVPAELCIPLMQHIGEPATPVVQVGQHVAQGECIANMSDLLGANVHAPVAGIISGIEHRALPHLPDASAPHIRLRCADSDKLQSLQMAKLLDASAQELIARFHDAGIVGMGGAGFPTAMKSSHTRDCLIINAAECEPFISCDESLLRESAEAVLRGGLLLARACGAQRVLIALEDSMTEAIRCVEQCIAALALPIECVQVPSRYPAGSERQLIFSMTGREVPAGALPRDIGVLVHNAGTAFAAYAAVQHGIPLTERVVTVAGAGVKNPGNYRVKIGTPISQLIAAAGGYTAFAERLIVGGPMMGTSLAHDDYPISKITNCVLVSPDPVDVDAAEMPCIRCGDCAVACPANLQPQALLWRIENAQTEALQSLNLNACIECGCCDLVCPSQIRLTARFAFAKSQIRHAARERTAAEAARQRFEQREQRLEVERLERLQKRSKRQQTVQVSSAAAAAVARAKLKKQQAADEKDFDAPV